MLGAIWILIVCLPALLTLVWFCEVLAGCIALRKKPVFSEDGGALSLHKTTVLIPAHNESTGILPTIQDIQGQLGPNDSILVVADNCTDDTAKIVRAAGVEVIVRTDPTRRGKGYALEFGVRHLSSNVPDVVVIMDADCRLGKNALKYLAYRAMESGRPIQSLYLMLPPENTRLGAGVGLFAWRVKNWLRPLGLNLMGLPTQLFGTGMAFPHSLLADRDLGNSRLAEDMALGIALASDGYPPLFLSEAEIFSYFPASQSGSEQQRQRWERGHFDNIVDLVPGALIKSVRRRDFRLAALAVDMAVVPLSVLVLLTFLFDVLGGAASMFGVSSVAFGISLLSTVLLLAGILLAWQAVGRGLLPISDLLRLPLHAFEKLGFYRRLASKKGESVWVRTDRK